MKMLSGIVSTSWRIAWLNWNSPELSTSPRLCVQTKYTVEPGRYSHRSTAFPRRDFKLKSGLENVNAVEPACAVVSVGRYNKFGHPSQEVLGRLHRLKAEVYRTDEEGAIIVESDGKTLSMVEWR